MQDREEMHRFLVEKVLDILENTSEAKEVNSTVGVITIYQLKDKKAKFFAEQVVKLFWEHMSAPPAPVRLQAIDTELHHKVNKLLDVSDESIKMIEKIKEVTEQLK